METEDHRFGIAQWVRMEKMPIRACLPEVSFCDKKGMCVRCDYTAGWHKFYKKSLKNVLTDMWVISSEEEKSNNTNFLQWLPKELLDDNFTLLNVGNGSVQYRNDREYVGGTISNIMFMFHNYCNTDIVSPVNLPDGTRHYPHAIPFDNVTLKTYHRYKYVKFLGFIKQDNSNVVFDRICVSGESDEESGLDN